MPIDPTEPAEHDVRVATAVDADSAGRLLHDFNREFAEPTPGPARLADRVRLLLADGSSSILLLGGRPYGIAVLRFRHAIWSEALECYLAELYVVPAERGRGAGRSLLEAVIAHARKRGADHMDLGTSETDIAARGLYESFGFSNREGRPDGPLNYFYEREL